MFMLASDTVTITSTEIYQEIYSSTEIYTQTFNYFKVHSH